MSHGRTWVYHADVENVLITQDIQTLDLVVDMYLFHWTKRVSTNNQPPKGCIWSWHEIYLCCYILRQTFYQSPWGERDTVWEEYKKATGRTPLSFADVSQLFKKVFNEMSPDVKPADTIASPESPSGRA